MGFSSSTCLPPTDGCDRQLLVESVGNHDQGGVEGPAGQSLVK